MGVIFFTPSFLTNMPQILLYCALIIGVCFNIYIYLRLRHKIQHTIEIDAQTQKQNYEIEKNNAVLLKQKDTIQGDIQNLQNQFVQINTQTAQAAADYQSQLLDYEKSAKDFYNRSLESVEEGFELSLDKIRDNYFQAISDFETELEAVKKEGVEEYNKTIQQKKKEMENITAGLSKIQEYFNAATEASKRAAAMKDKVNFYRIQLTDLDVKEIKVLREVTPYLRNIEPLNKVIWKCYYERPTTDLIGRVIGSGIHTGIYKITNIENGMCYVGQAVNLAERWKQHIKRGVGADTPTRNKLYPAMYALGPENFTFEVIEECTKEDLDEREDYWQDYFKAKEYGYSIK